MKDNKYYYDQKMKNYFYERHLGSFIKVKEPLTDFNLDNLLSFLTKPALTDIAKRLDLKKYSKLGKDGLINLICDDFKNNIEKTLKELSYKEVTFLKSLLKDDLNMYTFNIELLPQLGGLSALGLVFKFSIDDNFYLVVPKDLKDSIKKISSNSAYMKSLKEISRATNYIDGLMTKYGMLVAGDLYKLIIDSNSTIFNKDYVDFYINYIFRSYEAFTEVNCLVHPYVFSPENIFEELRVRQTIPYDFNDVDNIIALGEDIKSSFTEEINTLKTILIDNKIKKSMVDSVIVELIFYIKNDLDTQSIMDLLIQSGLKIQNDAESLIEALINVYNSTPMWILKGFTPKEIQERRTTTIKKQEEPGRNDPCPCGSGKKYKKCCLNK